MTEEEVKTVVNQYLTSNNLFKPRDSNTVDVSQDRLILDIVSNGREADKADLLQKKFVDVNAVIKKVVNSTKAWYKISTGDRQPIIRSAFRS